MENRQKIWYLRAPQPKLQCELSKGLGISPLTSQLLINRGINTIEDGEKFLFTSINNLSDPWQIHGIEKACERFLLAKEKEEKILIYGDYDVDGITATAIMIEFIQKVGLDVDYLIPNRLENGYGLTVQMMDYIEEANCSLLITVDCGINSIEEIKLLKDKGIDVIITDHHYPSDILPDADAIVNPKLGSPPEAYDLAGVGVAYKFIQALSEKLQMEEELVKLLDLVALGTVADIVPLFGDNRILAKEGLQLLPKSDRLGLNALMTICGIEKENITTRELSFGLAPRLNAPGRVGNSDLALELLLTESIQRSEELAKILNRTNQERQVIEGAILKQAEEMLEEIDLKKQRIIVLSSDLWHPGVVGIVASRLASKYYKPVVLISIGGNIGRGSARSIHGCNIYEALKCCSEQIVEFGGHEQAAGLTIESRNIDQFTQKINKWAWENLDETVFIKKVFGDVEVVLPELHKKLVTELENLAPFGQGNPEPILVSRGLDVINSRKVGKLNNHLKMLVSAENETIDAIGFKLGSYDEIAAAGKTVDLAFSLENNIWNGNESLQLNLKDIRHPEFGQITTTNLNKITWEKSKLQKEINTLLESPNNYANIFVVTDTVSFANILYKYLKLRLKQQNVNAVFLSGLNTDQEIRTIIESENEYTNIIFISSIMWRHYQDQLLNDRNIEIILSSEWEKSNNRVEYPLISLREVAQISQTKPCIIWVKDKLSLKNILKTLKNVETIDNTNISYWHHKLSISKQGEMLERFNSGIINILIAEYSLPKKIILRETFDIFADYPLDICHWEFIAKPSCRKSFLLSKDRADMEYFIEGLFPTKASLKIIYALARQKNIELKELTYNKGQHFLLRHGFRTNEISYKYIFNIFNEIGLTGKQNDPKVDLDTSWRYMENIKQHQAFQNILKYFKGKER